MLDKHTSRSQFCRVLNTRNAISGRPYRVRPAREQLGEIYELTDAAGDSIFVCRKSRFRLYIHGIRQRIGKLAGDYHLTQIEAGPSGLLIDCGANIGELGVWAREQRLEYVPFEPEPLEAACCDLNNPGTRTRRYALWSEAANLPFYSMPETADSSLIFSGGTPRTSTVKAVTLDSTIDGSHLRQVPGAVILKVEAEGAEPEVLKGASNTLTHVDYVSVDCGPERGTAKAHTLVEVANFLADCSFKLLQVHPRRTTSLFGKTVSTDRK